MNVDTSVEGRLHHLEARVRRLRWINGALLVLVSALLLSAMQKVAPPDVVGTLRARELDIVDEQGRTRISLGQSNFSPEAYAIYLRDANRSPGMMLSLLGDEARLLVGGDEHPNQIELQADDRRARVALYSRPESSQSTRQSVVTLDATEDAGALWLQATQRWIEDKSEFIGPASKLWLSKDNAYRCDKGN